MANDPAFLFYPGDWQGGTMYLTHEQKGCYMDLLILQFNVGQFTLAQAKQVLGICFDVAWAMLEKKFIKEGDYYYNKKLRGEIEKRKNFTKSRRDNALQGKIKAKEKKAYANHMVQHMENENENVIDNEKRGIGDKGGWKGEEGERGNASGSFLIPQMWEVWKSVNPGYPADRAKDFGPLQEIGKFISLQERIQWLPSSAQETDQILAVWAAMGAYIHKHHFYGKYALNQVSKYIQSISQAFAAEKPKSYVEILNEADRAANEFLGI